MVITTNDSQPTGKVEPKKLSFITTAIIPEAPKEGWPAPKGSDLSKIITTNDKPKAAPAKKKG